MYDHGVAEWADALLRTAAACRSERPLAERGALTP